MYIFIFRINLLVFEQYIHVHSLSLIIFHGLVGCCGVAVTEVMVTGGEVVNITGRALIRVVTFVGTMVTVALPVVTVRERPRGALTVGVHRAVVLQGTGQCQTQNTENN